MTLSDPSAKHFDVREPGSKRLLSIVCAVYNGAASIRDLLASYAAQQTLETELLIVDGLSRDESWSIVQSQAGIVDAAICESDRGIYDAWNKALPMCRSRFVSFIGCDDVLAPGALPELLNHLRQCAASASEGPHLVAGFNILTRSRMPVALFGAPYDARRLVRRMMIAHVLAAHRLDWLRKAGGFNADYQSSGDYELLLRERGSLRVDTIPTILCRMEDGGRSRQLLLPHIENYRARVDNGISRYRAMALFLRALAFTGLRLVGLK